MSKTIEADVVVIGAGPAGYVCAIRLAQLGKKVTVIEKGIPGGVCLNVGCIPSKALIYAGTLYEKISHASEMGITVQGKKLDFKKLISWKDSVVKKLTGGIEGLLKANGCTTIKGEASFTGPNSLKVGSDTVQFKQAVIATGSRPASIPGFEVDQKSILDSTGALGLDAAPKSLLCVGGGYIGLELGTFYAKIGTKVTIVEALPELLGSMDPDISRVVTKNLKSRSIDVRTGVAVKSCKKDKSGISVIFADGMKQTFEKVLITVGRKPNTDSLALENARLRMNESGFIEVNAQRQTNIPNIFAIGDVTGDPMLAHKGSKEGLVVAEVIAGKREAFDPVAIPSVMFTEPEVASVGLSEKEAREKSINYSVGTFPFAANGKALSMMETEGHVKVIGDKQSGKLLGVHIVGPEASTLIAEAALALEMGALVEDIALTIHAHPTLPEALMEAAEAALGHSIHIYQRKPKAPSSRPEATL